ncbi:cyclic pyranopterin phosphate synthase [Sporomusaceae bacterium BoRhaA]|uniref:GTP 3',8-cyclase MoaA n=1 Tax=Pelorhabdus rhamnosifermentans TaxID=2772457 RepID=UPI001C06267B|nr:GTP 3',8-cyclase MoaA [Pelorhabdus rhamnosifermentans]MBU2702355.1 cyclic pyranopterin phosphate synthase [Pelorhabdus rhamnosifermentans]
MLDNYGREIDYLRVSVTDRCNLRCRYCMPEEGVENIGHPGILSLEQIGRVIAVAAKLGIRKIRLTGGEPLVRKGITKLIQSISRISQIEDIGMTTNGTLFTGMAKELKAAGLTRINFSLDSLQEDRFRYITRRGELSQVTAAIETALEIGMTPVKLNVVVMRGINDQEISDFAKLAYDLPLHVRFIEFMPIGDLPFFQKERLMGVDEVKKIVTRNYELLTGLTVRGSGPAKSYNIQGGKGSIGFISPMSHYFCGECNRIRMTADGKLRGCLFGKKEINLKLALQNQVNDEKLAELLKKAIQEKPNRHHMSEGWGADNERKMYQIGG